MLTPQEITSKEFGKAVFGGYDMAPVDSFIESVAKDYADLYKENAVLKNKMKVLVEKIEEYRATEDAMRMALLTAQKMAKEITDEAEKKSRTMVEDAERVAREKIEEYRVEVATEKAKVDAVKAETGAYVAKVKALLGEQAAFLEKLDEVVGPVEVAKPAAAVEIQAEAEKKADEIEKSVAEIIENAVNAVEDEIAAEDVFNDDDTKVFEPAEAENKKTKFEFLDLQFGEDVDITK